MPRDESRCPRAEVRMADYVLVDGDQVLFQPIFGPATVVVQPGKLRASGPSVETKRVCVEGDERGVAVAGCQYVTPTHVIPGVGTLKIQRLAADQVGQTRYDGRRVLLRGMSFVASFDVD